MTGPPLSRDAIELTRPPPARATQLPGAVFLDPAVLEWELDELTDVVCEWFFEPRAIAAAGFDPSDAGVRRASLRRHGRRPRRPRVRSGPVSYETLDYAVDGHVATITLNRPDRLNAFNGQMCDDLIAAFDAVDADPEVRVTVVTGAGRAFCAGADLGAGGSAFERASQGGVQRDRGGLVTLRIFRSVKPVIGAINGPAVGVGATMTLPMDVRLMAEGAKIGFVFGRIGLVPEAASSWFLPRLVGISRALEWSYTGRHLSADEALAGGLVRSVHPAEGLLGAAYALAEEFASSAAPVSVALTRHLMWRGLATEHPMTAHRADSHAVASRGVSDDIREGVDAFLSKRPADFPQRVGPDLLDVLPPWEEPEF